MDIADMLIYLALAVQAVLVVATFILYTRNKLRLFLLLCLGFLALLVATALPVALPGVDTALYVNLLEAGAGLFFLAGVLSTV
jgi:predicted membrane channel-forming protein YqfA (hemolysin III family)